MSEVFNSSVLDAINRAVQDGISTTALEVDGTPQYCIINAETREIEIPGELNIFGVESDEKSTRVYFRCPKYVGTNVDLDMTQCMVYVPYRNANGEKDQYIVTDLNETEDGGNVEFTWLISRKASAYMGITEFGIRAIKTATGGTIEAEWNTTVASANVIRGMDVGLLEFSEENTDAIAQAVDLVKQEIELKGQETIATIPSDYTTVAQNALSAKNEVEGIRVGFDGITYKSAGEAVRTQNLNVLDKISKLTPSLMYTIPQTNGFLNNKGLFVSNSGIKSYITDYISVKEGEKYRVVSKVNAGFSSGPWIVFYNTTLKIVSMIQNDVFVNDEYTVTVPSGACYMRCQSATYATDYVDNKYIKLEIYRADDHYMELLNNVYTKFDDVYNATFASDQLNVRVSYIKGYIDNNGVKRNTDGIMSKITDYIPVKSNDRIVGKTVFAAFLPYLFYYDNKWKCIETFASQSANSIGEIDKLIPDGVAFIRLQSSLYTRDPIKYINGEMPLEFSISFEGVRVQDTAVDNAIKQKICDETSDIKNGILRVGERKPIVTANELIRDGALVQNGNISSTLANGYHSDYLDISLFEDGFYLKTSFGLNPVGACVYDSNKKFIKIVDGTKDESEVSVKDLFIPATSFKGTGQEAYIRVGYFSYGEMNEADFQCYTKESENVAKLLDDMQESIDTSGNVLLGKKYVACGDSFTEGPGLGDEYYDNELKMRKTYPWWIAKRNHMTLINESKSGSDFTNIEGSSNPFSLERYKQVPKDADYITLMFGLNETTLTDDQIGTKTDSTNTTLWGAYNVVFEYFLTNMPYAKIGVIISDAWMTTKYANTLKEICKYWGIPYLDLKGDDQVPMGIGGRSNNSNISDKAISLRNSAFQVSSENSHPNGKAHEYRSTIIENFLRSL